MDTNATSPGFYPAVLPVPDPLRASVCQRCDLGDAQVVLALYVEGQVVAGSSYTT
ncbi:MAG: hypothetical protein QOI01_7365 [Mycobacterium sp.]|nr:hypothetical protein [Mycobacterium sp.]